ncbi:hypothetical protein HC256_000933 [Beauveria bassiana]|nr:hypothetical protein HC256_000933 [Beauveria bassiana]
MTTLDSASVRKDGVLGGVNLLQRRGATTLGLGWLIAIVLCGGVSLFIVVGFALAWRAQKRHSPLTVTRTTASLPYEASGLTALLRQPASTTRLAKRRMTVVRESYSDEDEDKMTLRRFSLKRISSLPVLPPLPTYSTIRLFNPSRASYRKERGWLVDEEAIAEGEERRMSVSKYRQRPGSGSGWAGQMVGVLMQGPVVKPERQQQQQRHQEHQPAPPTYQQDSRQQPNNTNYDHIYEDLEKSHHNYHAEEEPSMPAMPSATHTRDSDASTKDFVRPAAAVLARHPSCTDSDLRSILRSTEQRLRDGDRSRSCSPEKALHTPYTSPTKPRSGGRVSRQGLSHNHNNSPTRYGIPGSTSGGGMGTREGSAAVGDEIDHASIQAVVEGPDDPFVEHGSRADGLPVLAPLRRTMTISSDTLVRHIDLENMPSIYRSPPLQEQQPKLQQGYQRLHKSLDVQRFAGVLLPPPAQARAYEDVRPKSEAAAEISICVSPQVSESSYTDISVDTTILSDYMTMVDEEEEKVEAGGHDVTPVKDHGRRRGSDASSSPFSEQEIVSIVMAAEEASPKRQSRRALPMPPVVFAPDGSVVPQGLSPPPKSVARNKSLIRKPSVTSSYYSNDYHDNKYYNNNNAEPQIVGVPASRSGTIVKGLSVCRSVAELRRMNSLTSNVSCKSLVSSAQAENRSTEQQALRPTTAQASRPPRMGARQYLSVYGGGGGRDQLDRSNSRRNRPSGPRPKKSDGGSNSGQARSETATTMTAPTTPERPAKNPRRSLGNVGSMVERYQQKGPDKEADNGKENAGLGISLPAPASPPTTTTMTTTRPPRNPAVAELAAAQRREKRGSVDSLGLYDKDGFLLPSPERELHKKLLRM